MSVAMKNAPRSNPPVSRWNNGGGVMAGAHHSQDVTSWYLNAPGLTIVCPTTPDEAYSPGTRGKMTANFWYPTMKRGVLSFPRPEDCPLHKPLREMKMKIFDKELGNFSGLAEFEGVV